MVANNLQQSALSPKLYEHKSEHQETDGHDNNKVSESPGPHEHAHPSPGNNDLNSSVSNQQSQFKDENPVTETDSPFAEPLAALKPRKKKRISSTAQALSAKLTRSLSSTQQPPTPRIPLQPHLEDISMAAPIRAMSILVASLGNPPPYHSTRHSAAHVILQHLQSSLELPLLRQKSKPYGGGHISVGADVGRPEITLYQSAVLMNVSGPPLLKAWRHFCGLQDVAGRTPGLVVLHDEMEIEPGRIRVRRGQNSAKGHNGLKSVQNSMLSAGVLAPPADKFVKIGIGIGRPVGGSRQSDDVSAYVLSQLTSKEKDGLQQSVGELATTLYREMEKMSKT